jgi:uncharacterized damage-inducible protein DinB
MKTKQLLMVLIALILLSIAGMKAQNTPPASVPGIRGDILNDIKGVEQKLTDLANAEPQEKYSWRPGEGVRSISEVFVHIADANFMFPTFWGAKSQEGLEKDMEKTVTDKGKVVAILKQSFGYLSDAIINLSDDDLDKPATMFGQKTTVRNVLLVTVTHIHEHLGQSIAYARSNEIVPPWTAAEEAAAKAKKDKKE